MQDALHPSTVLRLQEQSLQGAVMRGLVLCMTLTFGSLAYAADHPPLREGSPEWLQVRNHCTSLTGQMTLAIKATDWSGLERISQTALRDCSGIDDDESLSRDHENIAQSRLMSKDPDGALKAADECIQAYYPNASCHEIRGLALVQLGRISDAREQFDVGARVTAVAIADCEEKLQRVDESSEPRELKAARKANFQATLKKLQSIAEVFARLKDVQ